MASSVEGFDPDGTFRVRLRTETEDLSRFRGAEPRILGWFEGDPSSIEQRVLYRRRLPFPPPSHVSRQGW